MCRRALKEEREEQGSSSTHRVANLTPISHDTGEHVAQAGCMCEASQRSRRFS
eukprot:CAMPEP_0195068068 /NCGR_PEP_ID=MMETSP0448-20130528/12927_1 /TAXON_ID=66468 /ORGANISM="Heterocapsa triquestra, Strain CCMP 448" /LENGTH=52 /DNA_ID=CAMNT_0040099577 /DNA_START=127 /DNA_END=282 /DNA_ORIENTATION=+